VNQNDQSSEPTALDYAKPSRRHGNPVLGVVVAALGVCAGLFGALMLFYGIPGIVYVFTRSNSRDFAGDLFEVVTFLLIGILSLYAAMRWCRAVRGIMAGR
jgi:uncharacterized membrane protein HdeD (DUF308 family)